jgi:uncharacterized protein YhaN
MRITACRIEAFGPFRAREFEDLGHPMVVVQGPNESGKTSLLHFFQNMLYGLDPPDADGHPYAHPGSRPALEGQLRYRPAEEGALRRTIHRRLLDTPQARLVESGDGRPVNVQNRPLPAVAHVPREVFDAVYALSAQGLRDLSGAALQEVQARLLRMTEAPHVRPAGETADEIEEEAARLWIPSAGDDSAGDDEGPEQERTPRATRLLEKRRALREKLDQARASDRRRRAAARAAKAHADRLDALADERADLKAHLRRAERLRPVRDLVSRMEAHAERAGDLAPFEDLPDEPGPVLERLAADIEHYESEAARNEHARAEAQSTREAHTDEDRRVEAEADAIRAWAKKAPAHERRAAHHEELLREAGEVADVLNERARRRFDAPWGDDLDEALRAVPGDELEARVAAYRAAQEKVEALEVRADTLARKVDRRRRLWPWGLLALAGGVALAGGLATGRPALWGPGAGGILVGVVQALYAWSYNRERTERLGDLDLDIEEQKEVRDEKSAVLADLLSALPLTEEEAARPSDELIEALRELRRQAQERDALRQQARALARTLAEAEQQVAALAERCGPSVTPPQGETSLPQTIAALEQRLEAAEARHRAADEAEERLARLRRRRHEIEPALQARRERRDALLGTLRRLGDDDASTRELIEELQARRRAARRAEHARATLFREHPDWEARREEIRALEKEAGEWAYPDEQVVRMRERRDAVDEEIAEREERRAQKRAEAERHARAPDPADVASKLAAVERRLARAGRRRDHLALLAGVLRRAERAFRRKHQPEAIQQAGHYLRAITGGRYRHLALEGEENRLHVSRAPESAPQPVAAPLSRGLRDQAQLALRFALLDRLDREQEALPVFLDEVFATWDRRRRLRAYDVIEELMERRQVFVFTCHPALSEELSRRLDARRVLLEAPEAEEESEQKSISI